MAARRQITQVYSPNLFKCQSGREISERFPRVKHANETGEMALLTDAISRSALQFGRVHYGTRNRTFEMQSTGPMAALACNSFSRKLGSLVSIYRPGNMPRPARVAKEAFFSNRSREIGFGYFFEARSHVVRMPLSVIRNRRLKEVVSNSD